MPHNFKSYPIQIVLDQPLVMDVNVQWEPQLDYYMAHGDWKAVSRLLDQIPEHCLVDGNLQISLDGASTVGSDMESSKHENYLCSLEEIDVVFIEVPIIKVLRLPHINMGSTWLKMHMEEKLAKKLVFLKEGWDGTEGMVTLLARSGSITSGYKSLVNDDFVECSKDTKFSDDGAYDIETMQALHRLLVHYCVQYNLPYILELYLDQHMVALDNGSLSSLQDAAVSL